MIKRGPVRVRWNGRGLKPWDRRYRPMRDEDGHGDGQGGGDGGGGDGDGGGDGQQQQPLWYETLSDEAADAKTLSDRAWMANKGYTDLGATVKAMRGLESKIAKDKRVAIPGEDASDDDRAAYHRAIGVPETADGYEFAPPEGWEADMAVLGAAREAALKGGTPAPAWNAIVAAVQDTVMTAHNSLVDGVNGDRDATFAAWGGQRSENETLAKRGFEAFGFDPDMVAAMQSAAHSVLASRAEDGQLAAGKGGANFMLELGLKLGRLGAEDGFVEGGKKDFGVGLDEAQGALEKFENDREKVAKLRDKDPATVAEHQRLLAQKQQAIARREKSQK